MGSVVGAGAVVEKTDASTSANLPLHASSVEGDRVVCGWTVNAATLPGAQPGFTVIDEIGNTGDTLAPVAWLGRRLLTAGDITNGFVTLGAIPSGLASGVALTIRDYSTTLDFTVVPLDKAAGSGDFPFGSVDASEDDVLVVYLCAQNTVQGGDFTPPAGFTEIGDRGASGRNWSMGYKVCAAGATGAITPSSSQTTKGAGLLIGLQPNAAPPADPNNAAFAAFL